MTENLWGEIPNAKNVRTPASILLEQASVLTEQTKGLLVGRVGKQTSGANFIVDLQMIAPALNNYTYAVLRVTHGISLYPLMLNMFPTGTQYQAADEAAFVQLLRQLLSSTQVKNVISGLLAQIRADAAEAPGDAGHAS